MHLSLDLKVFWADKISRMIQKQNKGFKGFKTQILSKVTRHGIQFNVEP